MPRKSFLRTERIREAYRKKSREYYRRNRGTVLERERQRTARPEIKQRRRAYRLKNAQKIKAKRRAYIAKNRQKISTQRRVYRAAHRKELRSSMFLYRYGINLAKYEEFYDAQQGRCAVCRGIPSSRLVVDHDHKTGELRGLLCSNCNRGIGFLKDEPEVLLNAVAYLRKVPAQLNNDNVISFRRNRA